MPNALKHLHLFSATFVKSGLEKGKAKGGICTPSSRGEEVVSQVFSLLHAVLY